MDTLKIIELNQNQIMEIEERLDAYDEKHITYKMEGSISIGMEKDGELIAGLDACMTAFKILYVSTVFVDEKYRRQGIGRKLIEELEKRAKALGANMIRLDTFDWQGKDFYQSLSYEMVGSYCNEEDGFSEYFFLKRI